MPTLSRLLDVDGLGLVLHGDPDWLTREVSWATVTELDDPCRWLQGGELVLTTGLRLADESGQRRWVERLGSVGVAGIGFGVGLSHDVVPAGLLAAAAAARIPVLEVPYETPFLAIMRWVSDALATRHVRELDTLLATHDAMAGHLLTGDGLPGLLRELADHLEVPVAVLDEQGRILAREPSREFWPAAEIRGRLPRLGAVPQVVEVLEGGRQQVYVHPVRIDARTVGALLAPATVGDDQHAGSLLGFAVTLVGMELRRRHAIRLGQQGQIGQVLEDLVRSVLTHAEAERRLRAVGLSPTDEHRVLIGSTDATHDVVRALPSPLLGPDVDPDSEVVTAIVDRYVVVLCPSEAMTADAAPVVLAALRTLGPGARVGIGGLYSGVEGLRWSYLEARDALARGPGIHQGEPLSLQRLLLANPELPVRELGRATLGPLIHADREKGDQQLVTTLRSYLEHDGSAQAMADALYVHRNTVHHRIARIERLTGRRLSRTQDRVQLWLALLAVGQPAGRDEAQR